MDNLKIHHFSEPEKGLWISRKMGHENAFLCCIGPGVKQFGPVVAYRQYGRLFKGWGNPVRKNVVISNLKNVEYDIYGDKKFYAGIDENGLSHIGLVKNGSAEDYIIVEENSGEYVFEVNCSDFD